MADKCKLHSEITVESETQFKTVHICSAVENLDTAKTCIFHIRNICIAQGLDNFHFSNAINSLSTPTLNNSSLALPIYH